VLIVSAHPEKKSFTCAIRDTVVKTLLKEGYDVKESDLYKMKFNPVASEKDFKELQNKEYLNIVMEQRNGKFVSEITKELQKLIWCDYLVCIFPFWWSGPPAIMKGWFDRVLACGSAWDFGKMFENGLLNKKKGLIITSVGGPNEIYQPGGFARHTIKRRLFPVTWGTFKFCGITPLEPIHYHTANTDDEKRKASLNDVTEKIKLLTNLPPMDPNNLDN
jgi:NAD(P)H dehydrogenase (quinone)